MRLELDAIGHHQEGPLYSQLERMISAAIEEGIYKPGQSIEPECIFMSEGGLSNRTVGRAFKGLVDKGLIVRKRGIGTFVAHRPMPNKEHRIVGVVYVDTRDEFFLPIFQSIEAECNRNNCTAIPISIGEGATTSEDTALRRLEERNATGVLAIPYVADREHRELIRLIVGHMPVVLMDSYLPDVVCDAVVTNNQHGAYQLAQHLIELGHERIAFITLGVKFPYGTAVRDRQAGLALALRDANLVFRMELVRELTVLGSGYTWDDIRDAVRSLLSLPAGRRPTAIMCAFDRLALQVIQVLREDGIQIPEEMSITGFDNLSLTEDLDPPLTTVQQPTRRIGREAAALFFDRLLNPGRAGVRLVLDGQLVVRKSTSPPANI